MFTFACNAECPDCNADFREFPSIAVDALPVYNVDEYGRIAEENGAQLCLDSATPIVECRRCGRAIDVTAEAEE